MHRRYNMCAPFTICPMLQHAPDPVPSFFGVGVTALASLLAGLVITGHVQPWHVYATGFVVSILQVFQQPARQAMVPEAVDRAHLTNAIGLNSVAFNASRTVGPAVSGAIVAVVGPGGSYIV